MNISYLKFYFKKILIIIPIATIKKTQKYIAKQMVRKLKWYTRKYLFNSKEGSNEGTEKQNQTLGIWKANTEDQS
jgi:hypothetical protein